MPLENPLEKIKASFSCSVAGVVSILAIIGAGAGLIWGGELSGFIKTLIYIVLVIAIVVGAGNFMGIFNTSGALI